MLYGEALGVGFIVFQCLNLIASVTGAGLIGMRMWQLREHCKQERTSFWRHTHTVHFVLTFLFCVFWALEFIDYFGFWGVVPVELYEIFDDITSACGVSHGVLFAHFIYRVAATAKVNTRFINIATKVIFPCSFLMLTMTT